MSEKCRFPKLYNSGHKKFLNIAHRGASACFPENTMLAFQKAVVQGADMIELDVNLSRDKIPVVFHDDRLNVHTNGKGNVDQYSLKELKKMDAGGWFHHQFKGLQIPALEEVLRFAEGKIALNIEIKSRSVSEKIQDGIEEKCLELVEKYGMKEYVVFSSFDDRAIVHLRSLDANIPLAILYNNQQKNQAPSQLIQQFDADIFNVGYRQASQISLQDLNDQSIPWQVYTVNREKQMQQFIDLGASGIFTDRPDLLKGLIAAE